MNARGISEYAVLYPPALMGWTICSTMENAQQPTEDRYSRLQSRVMVEEELWTKAEVVINSYKRKQVGSQPFHEVHLVHSTNSDSNF